MAALRALEDDGLFFVGATTGRFSGNPFNHEDTALLTHDGRLGFHKHPLEKVYTMASASPTLLWHSLEDSD